MAHNSAFTGQPAPRSMGDFLSAIYILAIAQTDSEIFKAYAEEKGVDPYEMALGWVGRIRGLGCEWCD